MASQESEARSQEPAALSRRDLAAWLRYERKRLKLQRQAKDVEALQAPIEKAFAEHVRANGGPEKCVVDPTGWRLYFAAKRESVKWKEHFVLAKGSDAAEKIIAAQPTHDELKIEPPPGSLKC